MSRHTEDGFGCSGLVPSKKELMEQAYLQRFKDRITALEAELAGANKLLRESQDGFESLSNWRKHCRIYDKDMGYPERYFDEEQVEMMEGIALRHLLSLRQWKERNK